MAHQPSIVRLRKCVFVRFVLFHRLLLREVLRLCPAGTSEVLLEYTPAVSPFGVNGEVAPVTLSDSDQPAKVIRVRDPLIRHIK